MAATVSKVAKEIMLRELEKKKLYKDGCFLCDEIKIRRMTKNMFKITFSNGEFDLVEFDSIALGTGEEVTINGIEFKVEGKLG